MKATRRIFSGTHRIFFLAVLTLTTPIFATAETNQWNVKVVGLMVVAPDGGKGNRSFSWKPGVTVSAVLSPATGMIVKINQGDSEIDSFTDDKGTDLMAAPPSQDPFNKPGISYQSSNNEGGDAAVIIDFKASGQPTQGAATVNITGKVNAQVAGSTKQFTVESVEIKTNAAFSLGDLPIVITAAVQRQDLFTKKDEYSVTFSSLQNMDSISSLEFTDAAGNKLAAHKRSWGGGFLGYMIEYVFKQNPGRVKIVATCWQDLKTVDVPISIKTGVGI